MSLVRTGLSVALLALAAPLPARAQDVPLAPVPPDLIFMDGFESRGLTHWSSASTDGGDLDVHTDAALDGTRLGLRGTVDDTASLYVEDDSPVDEDRYRARFLFDTNGFDPGESAGHFRVRIFVAFEESPVRRLLAVILKRQNGQYFLMGRARRDDNSQADTGFIAIPAGAHAVEVDWRRASLAGNDGSFTFFIEDTPLSTLASLTNRRSSVDFVRLGALSVKSGASGVLHWDEFESHRVTAIGAPTCAAGATRSCYDGRPGTQGVGTCRGGTQYCVSGRWGPCTGEVTPTEELCNALDDDCNGTADDGLGTISCGIGACAATVSACVGGVAQSCLAGLPQSSTDTCGDGIDNDCNGAVDETCATCMHVSPLGNDATGTGSVANPFRTISAGIVHAAATAAPSVCVAAAPSCSATTAIYPEAVAMSNGVSVYGHYESTTWTRCASAAANITTITNQDARGVYFGPGITARTILDGFTINRMAAPTTAGVTVEGSTGAQISNVTIATAALASTSYGVDIRDNGGVAATPTIFRSTINGGNGTLLSAAVSSFNSSPLILANCSGALDLAGRCTTVICSPGASCLAGRAANGGGESYAVRLESSPGAVVRGNTLSTGGQSSGPAAGIRLSGPATGTLVSANSIRAFGSDDVAGVWLEECADAAPQVAGNASITATGLSASSRVDGVRALGACHPRIEHNVSISGPSESVASAGNGVRCGNDAAGLASACSISGNTTIRGSGNGLPPASTGVRCEDGACARIEGNTMTGRAGLFSAGLFLGRTGALVRDNTIIAGCGTTEADGVLGVDSFARLENNWIEGFPASACSGTASGSSYGVKILPGASRGQLDVHSNDIFAGGATVGSCASRGIALQPGGASNPRGLLRDNIVSGGVCNVNQGIAELGTDADPAVVENNDIWTSSGATVLYRDENATDLTTIAAVNALSDVTVGANISADPLLADTAGHLSVDSPAIDAGTCAQAPPFDFEGDTRPQGPRCDIGRDEFPF